MNNKMIIEPEDAVRIGNRVYFISSSFNGIFYSDSKDEKAHFWTSIPDELLNGNRLFSCVKAINEECLCLFPFYANGVAICDLETKRIHKIALAHGLSEQAMKFMPVAIIDNSIFMFELWRTYIYKMSLTDGKIEKICSWGNELEKEMVFNPSDAYFRYQIQIYKRKIYVPFCNINGVLVYDYINNKCSIKRFGEEENGYSGIKLYKDSMYCSPRNINGKGIIWNVEKDEIQDMERCGEIIIGMQIKNNKPEYCPRKKYSFIRSEDNLAFDVKERRIRYIDDSDSISWSVFVDKKELRKVNGIIGRGIMTEEQWLNLDKFLNLI